MSKAHGAAILALVLLLTVGMALVAPKASAAEDTPEAAVDRFFAVYPSLRGLGVTWGPSPSKLQSVISPSLRHLFTRAADAEGRLLKLRPNEVTGIEGDLWTSVFEGADRHHVAACMMGGGKATCDVRLSDGEPPNKAEWIDVFVLVKANGRWAIDDVRWGGDWGFMHKGTLRALLANDIKEADELIGDALASKKTTR